MRPFEQLQQVGLFADLPDDDLEQLCADTTRVDLSGGQVLFEQGDEGDRAYVVVGGEVEVVRRTEGREVRLAVGEPGTVIGEMALLSSAPRNATVRALDRAELVAIPRETLERLLDSSPTAARAMFRTLVDRVHDTAEQLRHSERMAQLGTLTAGVAHELNNPAAAAQRGARRLVEDLPGHLSILTNVPADGGLARRAALGMLDREDLPAIGALARSDVEEALEDRLDALGVPDAWDLAPRLADAGLDAEALDEFAALGGDVADTVRFVATALGIRVLSTRIADAAGRLSTIVQALKGYAFLDRAPVQDVDVVEGLENTLVLLAHQVGDIRVVRAFDDGLPTVTALGSELNQVWTNLIDNACRALAEVADPTLTLRVTTDGPHLVVEVEDNGPGIAPEHQPRIFDAFFTTRPPGEGTGLGLQTTYRIVVHEHGGALTFTSEPGRTTFRVEIPVDGPPTVGHAPDAADGNTSDVDGPLHDGPVDGGGDDQVHDDSWEH